MAVNWFEANRTRYVFARIVLLAFFQVLIVSCVKTNRQHYDETLTTSIVGRSEALFKQIRSDDIWSYFNPSLITHKFLACGNECKDNHGHRLHNEWLSNNLWEQQVKYMHRGELLYTLAELSAPLNTRVNLLPHQSLSVGDLIKKEARNFRMPPEEFHNARESQKGVEYGFLLRAFCHYYGSDGSINDQIAIPDVIQSMIKSGINRNTEAGTHELEGIAFCYENFIKTQNERFFDEYTMIGRYLEGAINSTLDEMREDGQLYHQDKSFYTCKDQDELCNLMLDLIKQTHFFEWAIYYQHGILNDNRIDMSLRRLDHLLQRISTLFKRKWYLKNGIRQGLAISAITHSMHVSKLLKRTVGSE